MVKSRVTPRLRRRGDGAGRRGPGGCGRRRGRNVVVVEGVRAAHPYVPAGEKDKGMVTVESLQLYKRQLI